MKFRNFGLNDTQGSFAAREEDSGIIVLEVIEKLLNII